MPGKAGAAVVRCLVFLLVGRVFRHASTLPRGGGVGNAPDQVAASPNQLALNAVILRFDDVKSEAAGVGRGGVGKEVGPGW
jgi:hypothetical protein